MSRAAVQSADHGWFFDEVAAAKNRVLLLDYDGTIAPFCANRHHAFPYPNVPELLHRIMTGCATRLIVVSGRAAREVPPLLGLTPGPETWGSCGLERLDRSGRCVETELSEDAFQVLARAETCLEREGLQDLIEVKVAGVAVHWRGRWPAEILKIKAAAYRVLEPLALESGLILSEFDEGVEIRLRSANKGEALQRLLYELDSDVPVAYVGDDASDEDAFRVLNGRGLTVLVSPKHRFTAAQMWLRPPDELLRFLMDWIRTCRGDV
ncbi:MAG TPA: trehalose-phosphatase [Terriglobia bacterium]|nr:trehalose-phosphatase [Terriglobia bacterium]